MPGKKAELRISGEKLDELWLDGERLEDFVGYELFVECDPDVYKGESGRLRRHQGYIVGSLKTTEGSRGRVTTNRSYKLGGPISIVVTATLLEDEPAVLIEDIGRGVWDGD